MVIDKQTDEYAPRWGYKRANDNLNDWAMEVKPGQDSFENPFLKARTEKKQRVMKNKAQQLKNLVPPLVCTFVL